MIMLKWKQKPTPYEEMTFAYLICNFNQEVEKRKKKEGFEKWKNDEVISDFVNDLIIQL